MFYNIQFLTFYQNHPEIVVLQTIKSVHLYITVRNSCYRRCYFLNCFLLPHALERLNSHDSVYTLYTVFFLTQIKNKVIRPLYI